VYSEELEVKNWPSSHLSPLVNDKGVLF
jgi:hypothetical protein